MSDDGTRRARRGAERCRVEGHVAPAEEGDAVRGKNLLDQAGRAGQPIRVAWEEEGADAEGSSGLEPEPKPVGVAEEQPVRNLGQQSSAVARIVGRGRAAVGHPGHRLERHGDDLVRARTRGPRDEAGAAGVPLPIGIELGAGGRGVPVGGRGTGTGRMDPLPRVGHGTSVLSGAFSRPERPAPRQQKTRSCWERAGLVTCARYFTRSLPRSGRE